MKKALLILSALILIFSVTFQDASARSYRTNSSDVHVNGYFKKNGTYVQPYYRSKADGVLFNNYSFIDKGVTTGAPFISPSVPIEASTRVPATYSIFSDDFQKETISAKSKILSKPPTPEEKKALAENELLNAGKLPPVVVEDDHVTHITIHAMATQNAQTIAHILTHIEAMVIKRSNPQLYPDFQRTK